MDDRTGVSAERRRFPPRLYRHGEEPDARFTLANERTFLAWVRTSLALIAAGVALQSLASGLQPGFRFAASLVLVVVGTATPVQAWLGWIFTEKALRLNRPLPSPALAGPIGLAVVIVGILVVLGMILP